MAVSIVGGCLLQTFLLNSDDSRCAGIWEFIEGSRGAATNEREPLLADAQKETELIIFEAAGELLKKTNTDPKEVCLHHFCLFNGVGLS